MEPSAAGSLVNFGLGMANQSLEQFQNAQSRKWSEKMYDRQLNDNLNLWHIQNAYNTPAAQMARLKDAGLNPNLIYGNAAAGGAASSMSAPNAQRPEFKTRGVDFDAMSMLNNVYDLKFKKAQIDNLQAQNAVIKQDAILKEAQTKSYLTGEEKTRFNLDFDKEFRNVSADARKEKLRQMMAQTDVLIKRDAREAASNSSYLKEAAERIAKSKIERAKSVAEINRINKQLELMDKDNTLKQLEIDLRELGLNPNGPVWQNMVGRLIQGMFDDENTHTTQSTNSFLKYFGY